jgi:Glycosyl hydrolases family 35
MTTKFISQAILSAILAASAIAEDPSPALTPRTFSHPDRIRYDEQCLTIDGKDMFIYSGAFHYFRCPKELWRDRFQKIKDAGFNTVETYTPWNWHEFQMPESPEDFSKITGFQDLEDWLTMAEEFGLYTIIRPGPYICAEWDNGGFPLWLSAVKSSHSMRSDDPTFLKWSKHWYDAVCPIIAKHQITRKAPGQPGVILVQVENEYDSAKFPDQVKINQVKALAEYTRANGIDVPLITCWTKQVRGSNDPVLRQIFDCCNFYPRWNVVHELGAKIPELRREQPDAPLATTELQGGWLSVVGGKLSEQQAGMNAAQIQNLTLLAWQMGETITNYYMLFGGTNFDDWGGYNITTTYDYNAPIREHGGVGPRYQSVKALGQMLRDHGGKLVRSKLIETEVKTDNKEVAVAERRATDGSRYIFVRTDNHSAPQSGQATVTEKDGESISFEYKLEPFGSQVLYLPPGVTDAGKGEWLPKPAPEIKRPTDLPSAVVIDQAELLADPMPTKWTTLKKGERIEEHGVLNSHFVYYRISANPGAAVTLQVQTKDGLAAKAGGKLLPPTVSKDGKFFTFNLPAGEKEMTVLHDKAGHRNGPTQMETGCSYGLLSIQGADATEKFSLGGALGNERESGIALSSSGSRLGDHWKSVSIGDSATPVSGELLTWYRTRFSLPAKKPGVWVPWQMHIEAEGNGFLYINGRCLGRYWQAGPQHDFYIPETWLNFGPGQTNTIALNLRPVGKDVVLKKLEIVPDAPFAESR